MRIAFIAPPDARRIWPMIMGGARRTAEDLPVRLIDIDPTLVKNQARLDSMVQECIDRRVDGVVLFVDAPDARRDAAQRLLQAGLVLVTVGTRLDLPSIAAHIDIHWTGAAESLGAHLRDFLGNRRTYILVHDRSALPYGRECYERFDRLSAREHTLTRLTEVDLLGTRRLAPERIRPALRQFRHVALVVSLTPVPWYAEPPDVLLGPDVRFATIGTAPVLWRWLRNGKAVALAGPLHGQIGEAALRSVVEAVMSDRHQGRDRIVDTVLVTPDSLDEFARRYAEAAGLQSTALAPWLVDVPDGDKPAEQPVKKP